MLKIELFKIWKSRIPILAFLILLVIGALFYSSQAKLDQDYYQQQYKIITQESYQIETELQLAALNQSSLNSRQLAFLSEYNTLLANYYTTTDEAAILPILIEIDNLRLQGISLGINIFASDTNTIKLNIARNKLLLEANITPIIIDNDLAFYPLFRNFHLQYWSFIVLFITVITGTYAFLENENAQTLKLTYSSPYKRSDIYLAKYLSALFITIGIYLICIGIIYVWCLNSGGVGSLDYTILFNSDYQCIGKLSDISIQILFSDLLMIVLAISFSGFISSVTFNHSITTIITLIFSGITYYYLNRISLNTIIWQNYLCYLLITISFLLIMITRKLIQNKNIYM